MTFSKETVKQIIDEMTLEEKAALTTGGLPYGTAGIPRLGIPSALLNDSMAGINFRQLFADYCSMETGEGILQSLRRCETILQQLRTYHEIRPEELNEFEMVAYNAICKHLGGDVKRIYQATSYPTGILLGATWDPQVTYRVAEALTREFDAFGVDTILTPNVNIQRDPLGGRLFESYSEDPCVTAKMGTQFIRGIQDVGPLADVKHFVANNHEKERKGINVHVSKRALREIYLPGFKASVQEGNSRTVMSAYNRINGVACSANRELLTDILRKEWGFDGLVISDWGGVYNPTEAILAGNDLEMPQMAFRGTFEEDIRSGKLPMEALDTAVERILNALLEMPCMKGHKYNSIDQQYSEEAAYQAVCEGSVLLKNEGILPLPETARIAALGEGVSKLLECGGGSAEVLRGVSPSVLERLQAIGGSCVGQDMADSDYVLVVGRSAGREGMDRDAMLLEPEDQRFVTETLANAKAAGKKTILVLNIAGPVDLRAYGDNADAIVCIFIPGCQGSRALADILYGRVNPSGKLAITFPDKYLDCPTFGNFPGYNREVWYGEGIFVGYRYYDTKQIAPRYPFGFGLSYTSFDISNLRTEKDLYESEEITVHVDVANTGCVPGKEVVQLYIRHENPTLLKPEKELKDFCKVFLQPGETRTVTFRLTMDQFASYDEKLESFTVEPGRYTLMAGDSSRNITARKTIGICGADPYGYGERSAFAEVWADSRCVKLYEEFFGDKCGSNMYNDLLGYTPDYPFGKAIRERVPVSCYASPEEKEEAMKKYFDLLSKLDIGKLSP